MIRRHASASCTPWAARLAALLLAACATSCFTADELVEQPCRTDADCNPRIDVLGEALVCRYNVCGYVARCGDGIVDEDLEQCDLGPDNVEREHGEGPGECSASACRYLPYCGDGLVQGPRETCDDENTDNLDACLNTCVLAVCGDGFVGPGEACDPKDDADCTETCARPSCGDGVLQPGEACDDGNAEPGDDCLDTCVKPTCGDGVVRLGVEECDDGNDEDQDTCVPGCKQWRCGDGFTGPGEACDDGNADDDACTSKCALPTCGDKVVQPPEECDDGNVVNADFCLNTCVLPTCGDGVVGPGEECDDANADDQDTCVQGCKGWTCGDGFVGPGEACDDGDDDDQDACTGKCALPSCGDEVVQPGEACDDGNDDDADFCLNTCILPTCGDAILHKGEECDDGNADNQDTCVQGCKSWTCGDGFAGPGEACDDGNADDDACTSKCALPSCGDEVVQPGEECDDGNDEDADFCLNTCVHPTCGDAILHKGEACDDGNTADGDGCSAACTFETCGDKLVQGQEQCDDGNDLNTDNCVNCKHAACGDGVTWQGEEQCDDGDPDDDDACLSTCKLATCGDGFQWAGKEACDDGNQSNTDACLNTCAAASCGDGFVRAGQEQCDDGNQSDGDACLHTCAANVCGDGFVDAAAEGCDDKNADDDDGCSNACRMGAVAIGAGPTASHTCVVRGGAVRCWGSNWTGQLGYGSTADLGDEPDELPGDEVPTGGAVTEVVASQYVTCVLLDTQQVRCWGRGDYGTLGFGIPQQILGDQPNELPTPFALVGGAVADIDAGNLHACARLVTGAVRCWGSNFHGELGQPGKPLGLTPQAMGDIALGEKATQIAAGEEHVCALLASGAVRCWGSNARGQLGYPGVDMVGDDETPESAGPVNLGGVAVQIDAGGAHTCARMATGKLRCWGYGLFGQLGYENGNNVGDDEHPAAAADVKMLEPGDTVARVVLGKYHTCALLGGGGVRCWGAGSSGQLGYGNTTAVGSYKFIPPLVNVGAAVLDLALAGDHTCALVEGGDVRCWGENGSGELGLNSTSNIGDGPNEMPPASSPLYPNP